MSPLLIAAGLWLLSKSKGKAAPHKPKSKKHGKAPPFPSPTAPPPPSPPVLQPPPAPPPPPPLPVQPMPGPTAHPSPVRPAPSKPRPQGATISDVTVISAQRKLNRLGAQPRLKEDGLFGPKTRAAWSNAAKVRRLDPRFDRVGPKVVRVAATTDMALSKASGVSGDVYIP